MYNVLGSIDLILTVFASMHVRSVFFGAASFRFDRFGNSLETRGLYDTHKHKYLHRSNSEPKEKKQDVRRGTEADVPYAGDGGGEAPAK